MRLSGSIPEERLVNSQYFTIEPGRYTGIIRNITIKQYRAKAKGYWNDEAPDGLYDWVKLEPHVELLNNNRTQIARQGMTYGIMKRGVPYSPNPKNHPIFSGFVNGKLGAGTLILALNAFKPNRITGQNEYDIETDHAKDVVVNVITNICGYKKNGEDLSPGEFVDLLRKRNGGQTPMFRDYKRLLDDHNEHYELFGVAQIKMKNVITDIQPLSPEEIRENGYYVEPSNGMVYLNKASAVFALRGLI